MAPPDLHKHMSFAGMQDNRIGVITVKRHFFVAWLVLSVTSGGAAANRAWSTLLMMCDACSIVNIKGFLAGYSVVPLEDPDSSIVMAGSRRDGESHSRH